MKENVFEFTFLTLNVVTCIVGMLVMFRSRRSLEPSISYTILAVMALTCGILSGLLGKSIYGEVWIAWGLGLVSSAVTMLTGASTRTLPSGMIGLCVMKSKLVALMFLYVGGVAFSRGVMPFSQMFRITYDNAWGVLSEIAFVAYIWLWICPLVGLVGVILVLVVFVMTVLSARWFICFLFKMIMRIGSAWSSTQAGRAAHRP